MTQKMHRSRLILQNGAVFEGFSPEGQRDSLLGEVVFSTGMTGYVESLTDPSFTGQILTFTYPLIGNYGVCKQSLWESSKIHALGVVVGHASEYHDHYDAICSFKQWLAEQQIPWIEGVDTRALTKLLRSQGVKQGMITTQTAIPALTLPFDTLKAVSQIGIDHVKEYGTTGKTVIAVDCGMKENILRCLLKLPIKVKRVPAHYDFSKEDYDGIFLSNGPADPVNYTQTTLHLQKALQKKKPIFGICLGSQLMAHAVGAKTYKLHFGHRGHNQPCIDLKTKRCYLTSQNHGYAIDAATLPSDWEVTFKNLNDDSVEGIAHRSLPYFSVQFHPEAAPGPTDTEGLFQTFYDML